MWRKFKWDMFVTSFIPLWLSIIVIDVWNIVLYILKNWDNNDRFVDNLINVIYSNCIQLASIAVIIIMVIISVIGIYSFLNKKLSKDNKSIPFGKIEKAKKANKLTSEFLLAYILPMIAFDFGDSQDLFVFIIYSFVLAYLCIRNNNIYTNILLEFKRYRIYTCDFTCKVMDIKHTYHDSIVISKTDLTQEKGNDVPYWDFENYIYIIADRSNNS